MLYKVLFHPAVLFLATIGLVWEAAVRGFDIPQYLMVPPSTLLLIVVREWQVYAKHLGVTAIEAVSGFAAGNLLAILGAVVLVHFRRIRQGLLPLAIGAQVTPVVAYAVYLVIIFGPGRVANAVIAGILSFFATLIMMTRGLEEVDSSLLDAMRLETNSRWNILIHLRFPLSVPYLFSALKVAITAAFLGAVVGEWISGGGAGLGHLFNIYKAQYRTPFVLGTVLVTIAASTAAYGLMVLAEKLSVRWDYR